MKIYSFDSRLSGYLLILFVVYLFVSSSSSWWKDDLLIEKKNENVDPIIHRCIYQYNVVLTFDDGPHPIHTPTIVKILNEHRIRGGFFLLGSSIRSYLDYFHQSTIHQHERPRLGFFLIENYSLIEDLFVQHDIYLHGWIHEKNDEMLIQPLIDNIISEWIEIGLLKNFRPLYRAPWGIGSDYSSAKRKIVLNQILNQIGIIPISWDISTEDYLQNYQDEKLIEKTLKEICQHNGGILLLHDNRPRTAKILDRLIRSIFQSGHSIVDLEHFHFHSQWNNQSYFKESKQLLKSLRKQILKIQTKFGFGRTITQVSDILQISFRSKSNESIIPSMIDPLKHFSGSIDVYPNLDLLRRRRHSQANSTFTSNQTQNSN